MTSSVPLNVLDYLVAITLLTWSVFALCAQVQLILNASGSTALASAMLWLRTRDVCDLIPAWNFFTGRGHYQELSVEYRMYPTGAEPTQWRVIPAPSWHVWLGWNPRRRLRQAMVIITSDLTPKTRDPLCEVLLLNTVALLEGNTHGVTRGVRVALRKGQAEPVVRYYVEQYDRL